MRRNIAISILVSVVLLACVSCAMDKAVTSYEGVGTVLKVTYQTAKPSCDQGLLSVDKCVQAKKIYNDARRVYILSGTVLSAIVSTEDAVTKQTLLTQYADLMNQYVKITGELTKLLVDMGVLK